VRGQHCLNVTAKRLLCVISHVKFSEGGWPTLWPGQHAVENEIYVGIDKCLDVARLSVSKEHVPHTQQERRTDGDLRKFE
jgi:hypothetical protein